MYILMICVMSAGWSEKCAEGYFKTLDECLKAQKEIKVQTAIKSEDVFWSACLLKGRIIR